MGIEATMRVGLSILCRVVRRRVTAGENIDAVLMDYPLLSKQDQEYVRQSCGNISAVKMEVD